RRTWRRSPSEYTPQIPPPRGKRLPSCGPDRAAQRRKGPETAAPALEGGLESMSVKPEEGAATQSKQTNTTSHLANERTHLAFMRTAISLMSFGVTINRFSLYLLEKDKIARTAPRLHMEDAENVGLGMVFLGMALMLWAGYRYQTVMDQIERGDYRPNA